jgi:hypothetical protein
MVCKDKQLTHVGMRHEKTFYVVGKRNWFDCQQTVMLCVTLHAAAKSDYRGFVGSKHKTSRKIENSDGNCTGQL